MTAVLLIAVVGALALLVCLIFWTGNWILRPLSKEAQVANLPTRYSLSDFAWLLVMLQLALGTVVAVAPEAEFSAVRILLLGFLGGTAVALWAFGINSLSRAGVTQPFRRGVFTVFLLPATIIFLGATGMGGVAAPLVFIGGISDGNVLHALAPVGGVAAWLLIAWSLRKVAAWVLSPSSNQE